MKRQIFIIAILSVFLFSSSACLADTVPVSLLEYAAETYGYAHAYAHAGPGDNDTQTDHDYSADSKCQSSVIASASDGVYEPGCGHPSSFYTYQTSSLANSIEGINEVNGISIISNIKGWGSWHWYDGCTGDSGSGDDRGDGNGFTKMTGTIVINSGGTGILDVNTQIIGDNPSSWDSWNWWLKIWKDDANNPIIVLNAAHMSASLYIADQNLNFEFYHESGDEFWPAPNGLDSTVKISINFNAFIADLDKNWYVDFFDYAILANDWRYSAPNLGGDITRDLHVDFKDLLEMANAWLDCLVQPASNPNPSDGTPARVLNTILEWSAGRDVLAHDVYFGTDFNDVYEASKLSPTFKGSSTAASYDPCDLDVNTTYYWRVDEVGSKCTTPGTVWNFTTIPLLAANPVPANGDTKIDPNNVVLSWIAGVSTDSHDVYLGTAFNDVNNAGISSPEFKGNRTVTNYDPCSNLDVNTTYYWRIDEKNMTGTTKGNIWNFKTWLSRDPNLVGWWKFDEGIGTAANDSSGHNNNGTVNGDAVWTGGQINGGLNFDGSNDYVSVPDNDNSLDMPSQITISAWVKVNNLSNYYEILYKGPSGTAWEVYPGNYEFEILKDSGRLEFEHQTGTGISCTNYISTSAVTAGAWQHVAVTLKKGDSVKFYINGTPVGTSAQTTAFGILNDEPIRIGTRKDSFGLFNGTMDDVRIYNRALSDAEIQQIYGGQPLPSAASNPAPGNGATNVSWIQDLSWTAGLYAASHDVYFGTVNPPTFIGNQTAATYDTGTMNTSTTYYWRIDEKNDIGTTAGFVWSFTTSAETIDPNLVSWWKFDETSGITAHDSADSHNGTVVGNSAWTAGQINGCLDFDGNGDYVDFGDIDQFEFGGNDFTIAFWFKKEGTHDIGPENSGYGIMVSKYNWSLGRQWSFSQAPDGKISFATFYTHTSGESITSTNSYPVDQWVYCAGVRDGPNKYLYLNGIVDVNGPCQGVLTGRSTKVLVGAIQDPSKYYNFFNGKIDDVRIYNRALSAAEIQQLYNEGLNP
jgi:hypothetical protein